MVEIKVDTTRIAAVFKELIAESKRGLTEDINHTAYSIALSAYGLTKKADVKVIKEIFAPTGEKVIGHKVRYSQKRITKKEATGG